MSKQLWAIEVIGPDDWFAVESLQEAREKAAAMNAHFMRRQADEFEPNIWAVPRAVDWTPEEHADALAKQNLPSA